METNEIKTELESYELVEILNTSEIFTLAKINSLGIETSECLHNSYKVARSTKSTLVEGLLVTKIKAQIISIVGHCWNKFGDSHFDATIDCAPLNRSDLEDKKQFFEYTYLSNTENGIEVYQQNGRKSSAIASMFGRNLNPNKWKLDFVSDVRKFGKQLNALSVEQKNLLFNHNSASTEGAESSSSD